MQRVKLLIPSFSLSLSLMLHPQILGVLAQDGILRFLDTESCQLLFQIGSHDKPLSHAHPSPDGRYLAALSENGNILIHDVTTLTSRLAQVPVVPHHLQHTHVQWTRSGWVYRELHGAVLRPVSFVVFTNYRRSYLGQKFVLIWLKCFPKKFAENCASFCCTYKCVCEVGQTRHFLIMQQPTTS